MDIPASLTPVYTYYTEPKRPEKLARLYFFFTRRTSLKVQYVASIANRVLKFGQVPKKGNGFFF